MFWLTYIRGDERTFWRTMTPARCGLLYKQYAEMHFALRRKVEELPEPSGGSLSQYLMGGG